MHSGRSLLERDRPLRTKSAAGHAGGAGAAEPGTADIRDFFRILRARPLTVVAPLAATTALALAYLLLATPSYTAKTSILIDARARAPIGSELQSTAAFPDASLVESQSKLIGSDTVLRRVVLSEKLADDLEFAPAQPGLRTRLFTMLGIWPAVRPGDDTLYRIITALNRAVTVKRSERTYVIDIEVASADPQKAARIANAVAKAYLADQQDAKIDQSKREGDWLKLRLEDLQTRLQDAETRVEAYKAENKIIGANGKLLDEQQLGDVNTNIVEARARTSEARSKLDQMQRIIASGKIPEATGDALKSGLIEKLRGQYAEIARQEANYRATLGVRHPALIETEQQLRGVRKLIAEELKRISDSAANEYQIARSNEAAVERQSTGLKKATALTGQSMVHLRELQREVDANRVIYEKFLRAREIVKEEAIEAPIGRVIAPASAPLAPSSPRQFAILSLALISGLSLGVGAAFMREFFASGAGPRARAAGMARAGAGGAPDLVLARIPALGAAAPGLFDPRRWFRAARGTPPAPGPFTASRENPRSPFSAAFRALSGTLGPGRAGAPARSLLVTATGPCEAKSIIAAYLAFAAAARGERTLLIAADEGSGLLRRLITGASQAGTIDLKGGRRPLFRVDPAAAPTLYAAPLATGQDAGAPANAAPRLRLTGLMRNFDVIIYDGPLSGERAAALLAQAVDDIILADAGGALEDQYDLACDDLGADEARLRGFVLTGAAPAAPSGRAARARRAA